MAKVFHLNFDLARSLFGIVDFYKIKNQWYARTFPVIQRKTITPALIKTWQTQKQVVQYYRKLTQSDIAALKIISHQIKRTHFDLFSSIYRHHLYYSNQPVPLFHNIQIKQLKPNTLLISGSTLQPEIPFFLLVNDTPNSTLKNVVKYKHYKIQFRHMKFNIKWTPFFVFNKYFLLKSNTEATFKHTFTTQSPQIFIRLSTTKQQEHFTIASGVYKFTLNNT